MPSPALKCSAPVVALVLSARLLNVSEPAPGPEFDSGALSSEDQALLPLIGQARFKEAEVAARRRLESRSRTCSSYSLLVEAARQGSWLGDLVQELLSLHERAPDEPGLLYGLALSLAESGEEQRAMNLAASAIHRYSPCLGAYWLFLHLNAKQGRLTEARSILEALVRRRPGNPHALATLGSALVGLGEGRAAREASERALIEAPPFPTAHLQLASLLSQGGRYDAALSVSELGLDLASARSEPETRIRLLGVASFALLMLGKRTEAEERHQQALELAEAWKVNAWLADTLLDGSELAAAAGDGALSVERLERASSIRDEAWARRSRAAFQLRLGGAFLGTGDLQRATAHLERGLALVARGEEPHLEADLRLQRVQLLTMTGDTTRALEEGARVLAEAIRLEDAERQERSLAAMGAVYDRLGRYRDALESYRQAMGFEERASNRYRQALALGNMALVYLRMGLPGPAIVHASQSLDLAVVFPDARLQVSLKQALAAALAGGGDFHQSERIYAEALELVEALSSPSLRGLVLAGRGRVLLALGRPEEAERHFTEALELAKRNRDTLLRLQAQSGLALTDWQRGDLAGALAHLEQSRLLVESSRRIIRSESDRISYGETSSQIYGNIAAIRTELDRIEPGRGHRRGAFEAVEQARARTLLDLLEIPENTGEPAIAEVLSFEALELGPEELLLEFELGERRSILWLLSNRGLEWRQLPSRSTIENAVESFLDSVRLPPRAPVNPFERHLERARNLYVLLLKPAESEIRRARRLIISPASVLYRLPFEALVRPEADGSERYLIETHALSYTPSASVLAHLRRQRRGETKLAGSFLGIAQPAQPGQPEKLGSFGAAIWIPHAVEEVEGVGRLFENDASRLIIGDAADERAVKSSGLERYRVLHIAAHGIADERFPARSGLFLGRGPAENAAGEDGFLRMAEVLDFDLASDLVVLSGCETGRGRLLRAEGALGFSWAFLSAGASNVAVSLWNVNDRATSELMVKFYERVVGRTPLPESLAEAKRAMLGSTRRAYRHPYYWAPFVLIGSAGAMGG